MIRVGTYGTGKTILRISRSVRVDVWELPPLPYLFRIRRDGLRNAVSETVSEYEMVRNAMGEVPVTVHGSHVPVATARGRVKEGNDYGGNASLAKFASELYERGVPVVSVNFHMPREQVNFEDVLDSVRYLASLATRNGTLPVLVTLEPQWQPHSYTIDQTYSIIVRLPEELRQHVNVAIQAENEFIRHFWNVWEKYSSCTELERAINVEEFWYKILEKLSRYNEGIAFIRYAKVKPYKLPNGGEVWKKRVPLFDNCNWCCPRFVEFAKAIVRAMKDGLLQKVYLIYTGDVADPREGVSEAEAIERRIVSLKYIKYVFRKLIEKV